MPMQLLNIPLRRLSLNLCNLLQILLIINAIPQHIAKIPQSPLQRIRGPLLLRLLKRRRFALAVLHMSVPDILMERAVSKRDSNDYRQPETHFEGLGILVYEVDLDVHYLAGPAIEAEDFVRELDAFLCC